jgi:cobalt/nickel transport system permease protein
MHMTDSLLSPAVGGVMGVAALGLISWTCVRVRKQTESYSKSQEHRRIGFAGVMGAFAFAAQMINFAIPGTGSSGHLAGGLLLAALLGPHLGFLAMAAILSLQAFLFADGGLLALGCNIFNLGFFASFIALPLVFAPIRGKSPSRIRTFLATITASILALQLGAFSVVLQTSLSNVSELPFHAFAALMQPIHLAIGIVEGFVTSGLILFLEANAPELLWKKDRTKQTRFTQRPVLALLICSLLLGGIGAWFASQNPDGLEWSIEKVSGTTEIEAQGNIHGSLAFFQRQIALLSDYSFPKANQTQPPVQQQWPAVRAETSASGIIGALLILFFVTTLTWILKRSWKVSSSSRETIAKP